jgi:hypothetical protein
LALERLGSAMSAAPANPIAKPAATRRDGARRARTLATSAAKRGVAPLSIPASADETCCSARGNMLRGNASQRIPRSAVFKRSPRTIGRRADGTSDSVTNQTAIRTNVTPIGATACSPSAMNKNDAPQITPGTTTRSHPISDLTKSRNQETTKKND